MKTFRYTLGRKMDSALTCAELIEVLRKYPKDMPVLVECEGVWTGILDNAKVEAMNGKHVHREDHCEVLVFDTDFNR